MPKLSNVFAAILVLSAAGAPAFSQTAAQNQPATPREAAAPATQAPAPANADAAYQQQVSYALGRQFGMNLKQNEIPCNLQALFAGIKDVMTDAQPKFTDEQLQVAMERFSKEMEQKFMARVGRVAAKNKKDEAAFLAQNKTQPGVQVTPSGLQYTVIQAGDGPSPTLSDTVRCNYRGQLLNGKEFDSSEQGVPAEFTVGGVIAGWTEALQKMKVGDKWQLFVPSDLAYGMKPDPRSGIEPGSMLIFEVELVEILPQ